MGQELDDIKWERREIIVSYVYPGWANEINSVRCREVCREILKRLGELINGELGTLLAEIPGLQFRISVVGLCEGEEGQYVIRPVPQAPQGESNYVHLTEDEDLDQATQDL